jgi:ATP-dependent DNA ligase
MRPPQKTCCRSPSAQQKSPWNKVSFPALQSHVRERLLYSNHTLVRRCGLGRRQTSLNHTRRVAHVVEDGPTVFAHACRLGAEGIVSKKVDGTYRSGPCSVWIKVRNPASVAVQRERSEKWNR